MGIDASVGRAVTATGNLIHDIGRNARKENDMTQHEIELLATLKAKEAKERDEAIDRYIAAQKAAREALAVAKREAAVAKAARKAARQEARIERAKAKAAKAEAKAKARANRAPVRAGKSLAKAIAAAQKAVRYLNESGLGSMKTASAVDLLASALDEIQERTGRTFEAKSRKERKAAKAAEVAAPKSERRSDGASLSKAPAKPETRAEARAKLLAEREAAAKSKR